MSVVKRWLWLIILVLGLISVVTGVFFVVMASSLEDEIIDGFSRTQVKFYDLDENDHMMLATPTDTHWDYKLVESAQDIKDIADNMKAQKYSMDDYYGMFTVDPTTGTTYLPFDMAAYGAAKAAGNYELAQSLLSSSWDHENPLADQVKYDLYFGFLGGQAAKDGQGVAPYDGPLAAMATGYLPTIDGQLVFGTAEVVLGLGQVMRFIGITVIVIGIALMLVAVMLFTFGKGFKKVGSALTEPV